MGEMADELIEQGFLQKALHDSGGDCGYSCPYCEEEYQAECRAKKAKGDTSLPPRGQGASDV